MPPKFISLYYVRVFVCVFYVRDLFDTRVRTMCVLSPNRESEREENVTI